MTLMNKSIAVFIPAYNEADTISNVVNGIKELSLNLKVYVIDDGSTDDTAKNAMKSGASVIRHPINLGGGAAIRTAFTLALSKNIDYIVTLDADCQHDPNEIPVMLDHMTDNVGIVIGSRFVDSQNISMKSYREYGIKFFSYLVSKIIRTPVTDVTSCYRIYQTREIKKVIAKINENQYYAIELLLHIAKNSDILEVPIKDLTRTAGKSKKGFFRYFYHLFRVSLKGSMIFL